MPEVTLPTLTKWSLSGTVLPSAGPSIIPHPLPESLLAVVSPSANHRPSVSSLILLFWPFHITLSILSWIVPEKNILRNLSSAIARTLSR